MQRNTVLAFGFGVLVSAALSYAIARPGSSDPTAGGAPAMTRMGHHDGARWSGHGRAMHGHDLPAFAAIGDLRRIERLYLMDGRGKDLTPLYQDVLGETRNPAVRNYVYDHLARAQLRPANPDQAIATLRKSLDENLARMNREPVPAPAGKNS